MLKIILKIWPTCKGRNFWELVLLTYLPLALDEVGQAKSNGHEKMMSNQIFARKIKRKDTADDNVSQILQKQEFSPTIPEMHPRDWNWTTVEILKTNFEIKHSGL